MTHSSKSKRQLRREMRSILTQITEENKKNAGTLVTEHFHKWLLKSKVTKRTLIGLFTGLADEVDTACLDDLLIKLNIRRALPFITEDDEMHFFELQNAEPSSRYASDILLLRIDKPKEPVLQIKDLDIIFVPGLAFDKQGNRLGRGKGYYDKALSKSTLKRRPIFIGLALDEQLILQVSTEKHDVRMDFICTPSLGVFEIDE